MFDVNNTSRAIVPVSELVDATKFLSRIAEKKSRIAVLQSVLFTGTGTIKAGDCDMEGEILVSGCDEHAPFTINLELLKRALKGANMGSLAHFEIFPTTDPDDKPKVILSVDGLSSELETEPADYFPVLAKPEGPGEMFRMATPEFLDWLSPVAPCISTEQTRYYLNGVFITCDNETNKLAAVATDGGYLAFSRANHDAGAMRQNEGIMQSDGNPGVILPRLAYTAIMGAINPRAGDDIAMTVYRNRVEIGQGKWRIVTKIVDGSFPTYQRVIPTNTRKAVVTCDRDKVKAALARLSGMLRGDGRKGVQFDTEAGTISTGAGGAKHSMPLPALSGYGELSIGTNVFRMAELVDQITGGQITFEASDGIGDPYVITGNGCRESLMFVAMPYKV